MMNRSNVLEIKDARLAELIEQNQTLQKERAALEQERAAMQACTRMPGHRTPLCTQTRNRADAPVRLELCCAAAMQADVEQAHDLYQSNQQHVTALQAENAQLRLQLFEAGARRRHGSKSGFAPSCGDRQTDLRGTVPEGRTVGLPPSAGVLSGTVSRCPATRPVVPHHRFATDFGPCLSR